MKTEIESGLIVHVYRLAWRQPGKGWRGRRDKTRVRAGHSRVQPTQGRAAAPV